MAEPLRLSRNKPKYLEVRASSEGKCSCCSICRYCGHHIIVFFVSCALSSRMSGWVWYSGGDILHMVVDQTSCTNNPDLLKVPNVGQKRFICVTFELIISERNMLVHLPPHKKVLLSLFCFICKATITKNLFSPK